MGGLLGRALHRRFRLATVVVAVALCLAACSGQSGGTSASGGGSASTLRFTWVGDLNPVWHPAGYETFGQSVIFSLIFDNLVRTGPDEKSIIPDLAQSWTANSTDTDFTFHLHHGVKWQDGKPFTSADVAFTIKQSFKQHFLVGIEAWMAIKGADDFAAGKTTTLAGLQTPDPYTVKIELAAPGPDWLATISGSNYVIVPEHLLKNVPPGSIDKAPFSTKSPVGTGPYKFVKYVPNSYVQFAANPDYFGGAPKIKQMFMQLYSSADIALAQLQSGSISLALRLAPTAAAQLKSDKNLKAFFVKGAGQTSMSINTKNVPDQRVRQAIYYAINRAAIVKSVFKGKAEALDVPPGFQQDAAGLNPYPYNPAKAKTLLHQAGWSPGKPFRIIYDQTYPLVQQYMPIIQQNLKAVGINAQLFPMDSTAFIARSTTPSRRGTFEAAMENGGAEALGPGQSSIYYDCKNPSIKPTSYANCQVDQLFVKAASTPDATARAGIYNQIGKILNTQVPIVYLWNPDLLSAASTKLGGKFAVRINTKYTFFTVTKWTLSS